MCKWGTSVVMGLGIPAHLSHSGQAYVKPVAVDACIAPIVKALNDAGVVTIASCCGHGHRPGGIILGDGREVIIARNFDEGRAIDALFPLNIQGRRSNEEGCCAECSVAKRESCRTNGCQRTSGKVGGDD